MLKGAISRCGVCDTVLDKDVDYEYELGDEGGLV